MGKTKNGGYQRLVKNTSKLSRKYPATKEGYFGSKGKNSREIFRKNPKRTAREFFRKLGAGGSKTKLEDNPGGRMATFLNGSHIVYRPDSKSGSPAFVIRIVDEHGKTQKIHFEPISKKKEN